VVPAHNGRFTKVKIEIEIEKVYLSNQQLTSGKDKTFNFKNWLKSAEKGWKYQAEIYYIIYTIPFSFSIFSQSSKDFSAIFNLFSAISEKS